MILVFLGLSGGNESEGSVTSGTDSRDGVVLGDRVSGFGVRIHQLSG